MQKQMKQGAFQSKTGLKIKKQRHNKSQNPVWSEAL